MNGPLPGLLPSSARHRYPGAAVAAGACAVSVLSFFVLPYAHLFGQDHTAAGWITGLSRGGSGVSVVWIVPVLTAAAGILAALAPTGRASGRRAVRVATLVLVAVLLGYLFEILIFGAAVGALRYGFWTGGLAVAVAVGSLVVEAGQPPRSGTTGR